MLEPYILLGNHMCGYDGNNQLRKAITWILGTAWEVLALCLAVWNAVKHFREMRRFGPSTGSAIRYCFTVLIESHMVYFAA